MKEKLKELYEEEESGIVFSLIDYCRDRMTELNDGVEDDCRVWLLGLGNAKFVCRLPECYHRFHRRWLYAWWFREYESECDEFGCEVTDYRPKVKSCPLCLREVKNPEELLADEIKRG